jgi:hypothetical protein
MAIIKPNAGIDLQVHPYLDKYPISNVIEAMVRNKLYVTSLQGHNKSILGDIISQLGRQVPQDPAGIRACLKYDADVVLLDGQEHNTREGFHVLTIGTSFENSNLPLMRDVIDRGLENEALIVLDHPYTDNIHTGTMGDISPAEEETLETICREYPGKVALELNGYCARTDVRFVLKYFLRMAGCSVRYHDVNKKAQELSDRLAKEGINVPTIATSDTHAKNLGLLQDIGTSRVEMDIQGETPKEVLDSIKRNIFTGNYSNTLKPVSYKHLTQAMLFPRILSKINS